jgi:hypothetical protein
MLCHHRISLVGMVVVIIMSVGMPTASLASECPVLPSCTGCGCRGGTGYRAPDGHCVGHFELPRVCGADPAKICKFENFPNTGLNKDCVRQHKRKPASVGWMQPKNISGRNS